MSYRWDVRIADWGQSLDSAYSIAPLIGRDEYPNLARLHRDNRIISENIVDGVKSVAQGFIGDIEKALKLGYRAPLSSPPRGAPNFPKSLGFPTFSA